MLQLLAQVFFPSCFYKCNFLFHYLVNSVAISSTKKCPGGLFYILLDKALCEDYTVVEILMFDFEEYMFVSCCIEI